MHDALRALTDFLPVLLLTSVRVGVMLALLPAPFGNGAPVQVRVALGLLVSLALTGASWGSAAAVPLEPVSIAVAGIGEAMVGGVIGLTVRVTIAAAEVAGNIIGVSAGQGFASSFDPNFGEETAPTGSLLGSLAVLIFFGIRGDHIVMKALAFSVTRAPLGEALSAVLHDGVLEIGSSLVAQGLLIASPVVATMFVVQIGMGFVARAAPRVQVLTLVFAVTSTVGLLVLFTALPSIGAALARSLERLPELLEGMLGG